MPREHERPLLHPPARGALGRARKDGAVTQLKTTVSPQAARLRTTARLRLNGRTAARPRTQGPLAGGPSALDAPAPPPRGASLVGEATAKTARTAPSRRRELQTPCPAPRVAVRSRRNHTQGAAALWRRAHREVFSRGQEWPDELDRQEPDELRPSQTRLPLQQTFPTLHWTTWTCSRKSGARTLIPTQALHRSSLGIEGCRR